MSRVSIRSCVKTVCRRSPASSGAAGQDPQLKLSNNGSNEVWLSFSLLGCRESSCPGWVTCPVQPHFCDGPSRQLALHFCCLWHSCVFFLEYWKHHNFWSEIALVCLLTANQLRHFLQAYVQMLLCDWSFNHDSDLSCSFSQRVFV